MNTAELVPIEERTEVQTITPMSLLATAQSNNASIEQMQQLFELHIRWEENEAKKAYHRAVAGFKAESVRISKDKQVGYKNRDGSFTGYTHATLGNVVQTLLPSMAKHGLSHSWSVNQQGAAITVTCRLSHEMGFFTEVTMSAGKDDSGKKNLIQQVASTVTYLQRYTFLAATGYATSDQIDDDGRGSEGDKQTVKNETKAFMPDEKFSRSLDAYEKAIVGRRKTASELINYLASKGAMLSDAQQKTLRNIEEGMEQ